MSEQLHPDESGKDCVVRGSGATKQNLQRHSLESQGGATTCHSCGGQRNYQSSLDYSMADFSPPLGGGISGGDMATYKSQRKRFFGFLSKKKRSDGSKVLTSSCFCGRLERLSCRGRRTSTDIQSRDAPSADECKPSSSGADIQPRTAADIDCPELSSAREDSLAASSLEISNECRSTLLTSSSSRMQPPPATPQRRFDHSLDPLNIATASLTRRDMSAATRRDERSFGLQQLCCTLSSVDSLASSPTADSGSTNRINDRRLVSTTVYPMAHLASNRMPGICGEDLVFTYPSDVDDTLSPGMSSLSTDAVATTSTGSVASDVGEFCCHVPRRIHTQVDYVHCLVPDLQRIASCSYYWGVMDRYEAERLLDARPEGTFLLRDSAQDEFLFSVSFRRYSRSLHARVEQWNHQFSFDSHDLSVFSSPSVCELIEHYKDPASCMFFEPMLTAPLARTFPFSLQALCRTAICSATTYDGIGFLPIPKSLHQYLQYYHYKQKVHVRRFESPGAAAASGVPRPPLPPMPNGLHAGSRGTSTSVGLPVMLEEQADTPV